MPIYFDQLEIGVGRAVLRTEAGAEITLCSIDLGAYSSEAAVRDRFAALVDVVANHYRQKLLVEPIAPASRLEGIPCASCTAPEADDVRHRAGQISGASELQLSPNGYPVGCCHRRVLGQINSGPDQPRPSARR
jgi:hypothetical protein